MPEEVGETRGGEGGRSSSFKSGQKKEGRKPGESYHLKGRDD